MAHRITPKWKSALAGIAALSLLAACGNSGGPTGDSAKGADNGAKPPVKLTYWTPMNANASSIVKNLSEVTMVPEWEKRTNVQFDFQHPSGTSNADILQQYGVMVASGDIPDVMSWYWSSVPGGLTKMQSDGVIIKLNDLIDKYAPNLKKIMEENPQVSKQIKTDTGDILVLPHLRAGQYGNYRNFSGLMIRKDWLDELGISVPETVDEWEVVLKAFKEKKGAIPFIPAATLGNTGQDFLGAFNISNGYFVDNGKVKYGPLQPEFKQYLALMQRWYKEGLIDQDYATNDGKTTNAKISSGKAGAFYGYIGSTMGTLLPAMKQTDPKAELVAVQYPVLKKGDEPKFIPASWEYDNFGTVITTNNKHPEETVKAMDYLFSPEGHLLKNFGTLGVSYTMENGQPKYTDLIMNNPEKLSITQALSKNTFANYSWTGLDDDRYNDQYYQMPEQKDAIKVYTKYEKNAYSVLMPPVSMTTDESKEYAKLSSDISTFMNETITKIVFGSESVDSYDKAIEQVKKMNIDRAIQIQQAAYDRFNKR